MSKVRRDVFVIDNQTAFGGKLADQYIVEVVEARDGRWRIAIEL